jgi:mono/diheme cytochrome c family protein
MNKKRAVWLFGGVAGMVATLTLSGMASAVETATLGAPRVVAMLQHSETRLQVAQAAAAAAESPVTYSSEQADRGEATFKKSCVECHGDDLRGGLLGGPPLRGLGFEEKFAKGAPAGALFDFMSATMPPDAPGRFSASTYADLMAYILKRNGFAAGAPLPSNSDALYNMIIEK